MASDKFPPLSESYQCHYLLRAVIMFAQILFTERIRKKILLTEK